MSKHFISAGIELQDGADLKQAEIGLRLLAEKTQSEPGCILFEIRQNQKESGKFTLWESWTDRQALANHFEMPHTKDFLAQNLTQVSYIEELAEIGEATKANAA
jgi:quinol monooxygenase YgiN